MSTLEQELRKEIEKQNLAKEAKVGSNVIIRKKFKEIKLQMIDEFLRHPVTIEIQAGALGPNLSNTLAGVTNLFSFIGFESGSRPIEPILDLLNKTSIEFLESNGTKYKLRVNIPEPQEIFNVTPLPYMEGRSWAQGIERGISGLPYFLKTTRGSRSGFGIQTDKPVRKGVKFKNTKYISSLINKYKKKFKELK